MNVIKSIKSHGCFNGACPGLLVTEGDLVLIQGNKVGTQRPTGVTVPDHEDLVAIPKAVFDELIAQYRSP